MGDPNGTPIRYELLTPDPEPSRAFDDAVVGWTIAAQPWGGVDDRMIDTGRGLVGGMMRLTDAMRGLAVDGG